MRSSRQLAILLFMVIILGATTKPTFALVHHFVEDFSTKEFCDTANTSALWDTVIGELRLPPFEITEIGSFDSFGTAYGLAVAGNHAYLADWSGGLVVVDITDPAKPVLAGSMATPGDAFKVTVFGDLAFVADNSAGLTIVDISDPTAPTWLASISLPDNAYAAACAGRYVYVAAKAAGLQVVDVSDPAAPFIAGSYNTPGIAYGVALDGDYAYVADSAEGVRVLDISDPTTPVSIGVYDTPGYAWEIVLDGDLAYVADDAGGLLVLDVSDPTMPAYLGGCATPAAALGLSLSGDHLYVCASTAGLLQVDVSDPAFPVLVKVHNTPDRAYDLVLAGEHAFVADASAGLRVMEVCILAPEPQLAAQVEVDSYISDMETAGDYIFAAAYVGLRVFDFSQPNSLVQVAALPIAERTHGVALAGDLAYLTANLDSLYVVDIADPTQPAIVATCPLSSFPHAIEVRGNFAYLSCDVTPTYLGGLSIVDISNPLAPVEVGYYDAGGRSQAIALAGDYAFLGVMSGMHVINISDPSNPTLAGSFYSGGSAWETEDLALAGDMIYLLSLGVDVVYAVDISDPTNPTSTGYCNTLDTPYGIAVSGDLAFVAEEDYLQVFDISDDPEPIYHQWISATQRVATLAGDRLLLADYSLASDHALRIFHVFDREFCLGSNAGQSTLLDTGDNRLVAMRLAAEQAGEVNWEISADAGAHWTVPSEGNYEQLDPDVFGNELLWRSKHVYNPADLPGVNPTASRVEIDWLHDFAPIDSIVDVPADQGGWVRVYLCQSGWDLPGSLNPVSGYTLFRRVDDPVLCQRILLDGGDPAAKDIGKQAVQAWAAVPGGIVRDGREFVLGGAERTDDFPPGLWEAVGGTPAFQSEQYLCLAPTLEDSSETAAPSVYCVFTATTNPSIFFVSPPDSGLSVDNIAPGVPTAFRVAYDGLDGNALSWADAAEPDFQFYRVYRGDEEDFPLGPKTLVHETASPAWLDKTGDLYVHYKVTALDHAGNESDPASPEEMTDVAAGESPRFLTLRQNAPNPFNPSTRLSFTLPAAGRARLVIYDVTGQYVATLLDRRLDAGVTTLDWRAVDDSGRDLPSGVYFYCLDAAGRRETRKMVLLR